MPEIVYQCMKCRGIFPQPEWDRTGRFKCPDCGFAVAVKVRPPIVKRIKAK